MSLIKTQAVLARLYTDSTLRERFLADPEAIGPELGLDADEVQAVASLSGVEVRAFARSLLRKRLGEIAKLLSLTRQVLGQEFDTLFLRYAQTQVPQGIKKHHHDAIAFVAYLAQPTVLNNAGTTSAQPGHVIDLAQYEAAWLVAAMKGRYCLVRRLRFHPGQLIETLRMGQDLSEVRSQNVLACWLRISRRTRLWHIIIALPTRNAVGAQRQLDLSSEFRVQSFKHETPQPK